MTTTVPYRPDGDDPRSIAQLMSNFDAITAALDAHLAVPGLNFAAAGKNINLTENQIANQGNYVYMPSPDRVTGITLPADGLIAVWYRANFTLDGANAQGKGAIFLDSTTGEATQVQISHEFSPIGGIQTNFQAADLIAGQTGQTGTIASFGAGLAATTPRTDLSASDVSTGQIVGAVGDAAGDMRTEVGGNISGMGTEGYAQWGGPCYIYAAAGTYEVGIKFKQLTYTLKVRNRRLWVAAFAF